MHVFYKWRSKSVFISTADVTEVRWYYIVGATHIKSSTGRLPRIIAAASSMSSCTFGDSVCKDADL
jgi:hypothetical protein